MTEMLDSPTSLSPSEINGTTDMGGKVWTGAGGRRRKSRVKKSKTVGGMKKTMGEKKSRRTGKKGKKSKSKSKSRKSRRR